MEDHKDLEVGPHKYRIGLFGARDGSWILSVLMSRLFSSEPAGGDGLGTKNVLAAVLSMPQEQFDAIQGHALAVCQRYESGLPKPIFLRNPDTWVLKDLQFDIKTVMALTVQAISFNLSPFFQEGGLSGLREMLPDLPSTTPTSPL